MRQKWITLSFILCMLLSCTMTVFAQDLDFERKGSVSVTLTDQEENVPIAGANFALYRVADIESDGSGSWQYVLEEVFQEAGIVIDDPAVTIKLESLVEEQEVPVVKRATDAQGKVVFPDLPLGLYFVKQEGVTEGFAACRSFLVTVPINSEGVYVYDVDASPKTEVTKLTSIVIKKVWNTGKSVEIPDQVTVQLLKDGVVLETVTLNEENKWMVTLDNMPVSDVYSIKEVHVPKGFTATYAQNGYEFTVTNTASLAQTGQLVWPIPVLVMAGLFFLFAGVIILHKTRRRDA